jgi:pilus assembly protein CpaC
MKFLTTIILLNNLLAQDTVEPLPPPVEPSEGEKEVIVYVGIDTSLTFDFSPSPNIQVGNDSVLTYTFIPQKREIVLKGIKPGNSSLTVRDSVGTPKAKYLIRVQSSNNSSKVQKLKELLGDIEGLEIGIKADMVYLGGQLVVPEDVGRIVLVLEKFPDVLRLIELSPHTQLTIAEKMQKEIQDQVSKDVTVRVVNTIFWLEGEVASADDRKRAEDIAVAYIPDKLESLARRTDSVRKVVKPILQNFIIVKTPPREVDVPKIIKITAQFIELSKNYGRVFGLSWNPLLSATAGNVQFGKTVQGEITTRTDGALAGTISNFFPKLATAKAAGYAHILQSGVVVIKNGSNGSINKLSKKTLAVGSGEFTEGKEFTAGFNLSVTPNIIKDEEIELRVDLNVSSFVGNSGETMENRIATELLVTSRDTAVIGGIVVNKKDTIYDKDNPYGEEEYEGGYPLFSFLRSKNYNSSRSQFAVFITPVIVTSAATETEEVKRKFRKRSL